MTLIDRRPWRRPAGADFYLACLLALGSAAAGAADDPVIAVTPPQPVVMAPTAALPPPPAVPQPAASSVQSAKAAKQTRLHKPGSRNVKKLSPARGAGKARTAKKRR